MPAPKPSTMTASELRELLRYDPETGEFVWLQDRGRNPRSGRRAGAVTSENRIIIRVNYRIYFAHRLAWLYMTGEWPERLVDHIDGNPSNNRWRNLRAATPAQNAMNSRRKPNKVSGIVGVHFFKQYGMWRSCISANGQTRFLGYFREIEDARAAYEAARRDLHGEFAPREAA